jgi:hypothetical protein
MGSLCRPLFPSYFRSSDRQICGLSKAPNQRKLQQPRLGQQPFDPARWRVLRVAQAKLIKPFRIPVDERLQPESLNEALQLALRDLALGKIDEVRPNPPLRKEAQCLPGFGAFLQSEDLDFHDENVFVKSRAR